MMVKSEAAFPESAPITACVSARQMYPAETKRPQPSAFDAASQSAWSSGRPANESTLSAGKLGTTTVSRRLRNARRSEHTHKKPLADVA